jgi:hypothetical protein
MYFIIGTTHKGEQFAIGHTTSKRKAEKIVASYPDDEYREATAFYSRPIH